MGEEKQSSHDPLYTNKHSAPSPLNMSCHSLCPIVHTTTTTTRGMMMRICIQPSPCRCVRIVHGRSCPDDLGPRNSPEVIPGDRWAKAKMHNKVVMGFERARENHWAGACASWQHCTRARAERALATAQRWSARLCNNYYKRHPVTHLLSRTMHPARDWRSTFGRHSFLAWTGC